LNEIKLQINDSWADNLTEEFSKDYFLTLESFLQQEELDKIIFPKKEDIFNAYNMTDIEDIKVVILGQDPYHGINQSHGFAFSVNNGIKFPPSLRNIFKELTEDIGCAYPTSGNLIPWAKQGVFLLNTVLTVRANNAGSHQNKGWEYFTDETIKIINKTCNNVVFILWGKPAQSKEKFIDDKKHLILKAPHPSPLSSYRGFFGSKPFSNTNIYLVKNGKKEIDWCLK